MQVLQRFRIGARLAVAFSILLLFIVAMGGLGFVGVTQLNQAAERMYQSGTVPMARIAEVNYLTQRNRVLLMDMMHQQSLDVTRLRSEQLETGVKQIAEEYEAFKREANFSDEMRKLATAYETAYDVYLREGLLAATKAMTEGNVFEAHQLYKDQVDVLAPAAENAARELLQYQVQLSGRDFERAQGLRTQVSFLLLVAGGAALVIGVLLALTIARSIAVPIRHAVQMANTVAAGDLTTQLDTTARDETGELLRALKTMSDNLAGIVAQVRQGSDSIATGSTEIASGNADLSQRTETQASSLEETAASMEELTATVNQNAETARQASQLASEASRAAASGGEVVSEVVSTMHEISASSRKIEDIISVIDGIAFQTNILALNAAVEAARAGEQGRGFAVVAGEVRTLAQRSANAAKDIKGLIGASVERVDHGSQLVERAGAGMTGIVQQVRRVNDLIAEITAASHEQSTGIAQVGEAISQLDQVTQQNAALVEQSAAAAESLKLQAARLVEAVGVFRLSGEYALAQSPAAVSGRATPSAARAAKPRLAAPTPAHPRRTAALPLQAPGA